MAIYIYRKIKTLFVWDYIHFLKWQSNKNKNLPNLLFAGWTDRFIFIFIFTFFYKYTKSYLSKYAHYFKSNSANKMILHYIGSMVYWYVVITIYVLYICYILNILLIHCLQNDVIIIVILFSIFTRLPIFRLYHPDINIFVLFYMSIVIHAY